MGILERQLCALGSKLVRLYSATAKQPHKCKLLVIGGGTGGCSVAWRFSRRMKEKGQIIVIEPADYHYYQPLFTLVGAGLRRVRSSRRPMDSVLPTKVKLMKDMVAEFDPCNNTVYTLRGERVSYDFLVVAMGLENQYDKVPGLRQALEDRRSGVSTIYSPDYCSKTWKDLKRWRGGHAIFTFLRQGGKCPGAAQKIMYLADDYWRKKGVRHLTNITYNTGGAVLFGVAKYARTLTNVAWARDVTVNTDTELQELTPRGAVFSSKDSHKFTLPYNLLHVTPPMGPPGSLACSELADDQGYLKVDKFTLQHQNYANIFGLGDCTTTPNSKTAAAVGSQSYVLERNLVAAMSGAELPARYDGYGACPMLTSYKTGVLAEFVYDKKPMETFPFDQSQERRVFFQIKTKLLPPLYWHGLIKGKFNGPAKIRRILNPFGK